MEVLFEEEQLRVKVKKPVYSQEPRVAVLSKALLDPAKYNNYKLWHLLNENKIEEALVIQAAEMIEPNKWKNDADITFPPGSLFMMNLFRLFEPKDMKNKLAEIIKACIYPNHEEELALIEQSYNAVNTNLIDGLNSFSMPRLLPQEYMGHPKHKNSNNCLSMNILAGFMTVLGASAVAVALIALSGAVCTAVAVTGAAIGLTGLGLFAFNGSKCLAQPDNKHYSPTV